MYPTAPNKLVMAMMMMTYKAKLYSSECIYIQKTKVQKQNQIERHSSNKINTFKLKTIEMTSRMMVAKRNCYITKKNPQGTNEKHEMFVTFLSFKFKNIRPF